MSDKTVKKEWRYLKRFKHKIKYKSKNGMENIMKQQKFNDNNKKHKETNKNN